jgi:hypothetical protein
MEEQERWLGSVEWRVVDVGVCMPCGGDDVCFIREDESHFERRRNGTAA